MKDRSIALFVNAVLILFLFSLSHAEELKIEFTPTCGDNKSTPFSAKLNCESGEYWLEQGHHEKALGLFKEAVREYPTYEFAKQKIKELETLIPKLRKIAEKEAERQANLEAERRQKEAIYQKNEQVRRQLLADEERRKSDKIKSEREASDKALMSAMARCESECSVTKYSHDRVCYDGCITQFIMYGR